MAIPTPTAYWKLDESSGNAADSVGSNTLTTRGTVTYAAAKINNGAVFGTSYGTTNSLGRADGLGINLSANASAFFWIKLDSEISSSDCVLFSWRSTTGTARYFDLRYDYNGGSRRFNVYGGSGYTSQFTASSTLGTGWNHIAITLSGGTMTIYLNGSSIGSGSLSAHNGGNWLWINGASDNTSSGAPSTFDEVSVCPQTLSVNEVSKIYNAGRGNTYPFTNDLTTGLVSYWKFDESSGNAVDSVGSATLTNTNVTYAAGKINNGAVFNGTSSKLVKTAYAVGIGNTWSYAGWFNPDVLDITNRTLFNIRPASGNINNIALEGLVDGYVRSIVFNSGGANIKDYRTTSLPLSVGTWYHIAVTWDGTNHKIYVNAAEPTLTKSVDTAGSMTSTDRGVFVGNEGGTGNYWDGMHDELGLWDVALSSTEVSELYNSGAGKTYPFASTQNSNFLALF